MERWGRSSPFPAQVQHPGAAVASPAKSPRVGVRDPQTRVQQNIRPQARILGEEQLQGCKAILLLLLLAKSTALPLGTAKTCP